MTKRVLNNDIKKELNFIEYSKYTDGCKITLESKIVDKVVCEFLEVKFEDVSNSIFEGSFVEVDRLDDRMVIIVTNGNLINTFTIMDLKVFWSDLVSDYDIEVVKDMSDDDRDDVLDEIKYNLYNTVIMIESDLEIPLITYNGLVEKCEFED